MNYSFIQLAIYVRSQGNDEFPQLYLRDKTDKLNPVSGNASVATFHVCGLTAHNYTIMTGLKVIFGWITTVY